MNRTWTPLTPAAAQSHLAAAAERFAAVLLDGDPDAPVPTCPGWDLRSLAHHLGNVHRWSRGAILEGHPGTAGVDAPAERPALAAWYRECAADLLDTLRSVDPDRPCWTFGPEPRTASFWSRRQAHETAMHAQDAALSQGGPVPRLDRALALDGIDEVVTLFLPRQVRLGRIAPLTRSLAVVADEVAGAVPGEVAVLPPGEVAAVVPPGGDSPRWVLAGDGTGPASSPQAPADVELHGPADLVLQLLWRRVTPADPRFRVTGDPAALDAVLGLAIAP